MKRVLFVCTGVPARSQMAAALLHHLAGDRFDVQSAGTGPEGLAPETVAVMAEIGIDVSEQRSNHVDQYARRRFDYVITVSDAARQACPTFPGRGQRLHWDVEDPADAEARGVLPLDALRAARDVLRERVSEFALKSEGPTKALLRLPWRKRPALFWALARDHRVPLAAKLVLPAMALYLVMPLDPIPDFIPVAGYLDDLLVVALGLWLFLRLCPGEVFWEHIARLAGERVGQ